MVKEFTEYYENTEFKKKHKEKMKEMVECICGHILRRYNMSHHKKSKLHKIKMDYEKLNKRKIKAIKELKESELYQRKIKAIKELKESELYQKKLNIIRKLKELSIKIQKLKKKIKL